MRLAVPVAVMLALVGLLIASNPGIWPFAPAGALVGACYGLWLRRHPPAAYRGSRPIYLLLLGGVLITALGQRLLGDLYLGLLAALMAGLVTTLVVFLGIPRHQPAD